MPGYKGHLVGGLVIYALGLYLLRSMHPAYGTMAEWLACALAGALFPDVDVKSKGQKGLYKILLIVFIVLLLKGKMQLFILLSVLAVVPMIVKHRGIFHKLWFVIALPCVAGLAVSLYYPHYATILLYDVSFFIAGAVSHLWLDLGLRRMVRL